MDSYTKKLHIKSPIKKVYEAISTQQGVAGWWTQEVEMDTRVGGVMTVRFDGGTYVTMKIRAATDNQEVMWGCTSQYFKIKGTPRTDEWVGTTIRFHLEDGGDGTTTLIFTHEGLTSALYCYQECVAGWDYFLASLKSYLEERKGTPYIKKQ
jgi:uncharacterized protein YndB with AHSA1/START domain